MNDQLDTSGVQNNVFSFTKPKVAIFLIGTIGICYCVTVIVNAKYNRDINVKVGSCTLKIRSVK